jgi:hypothetical protein
MVGFRCYNEEEEEEEEKEEEEVPFSLPLPGWPCLTLFGKLFLR